MNRLRLLREERKWTQKYLGSLLHVKNAAISKYETGRASLTEDTIIKASQLFGVSTDYLLGLSDSKNGLISYEDSQTNPVKIEDIREDSSFPSKADYTADEQKLIAYYHRLDEENKDYIKGRMIDLYKEQLKILENAGTKM